MNDVQHQDDNDSPNPETADGPTESGWQRYERTHHLTAGEPTVSVRMNVESDATPSIGLLKVAREKLGEPSAVRLYHDGESRVAFESVDEVARIAADGYVVNERGVLSAGVIKKLDVTPEDGRYRLHYESDTGLWYVDLSEDPR